MNFNHKNYQRIEAKTLQILRVIPTIELNSLVRALEDTIKIFDEPEHRTRHLILTVLQHMWTNGRITIVGAEASGSAWVNLCWSVPQIELENPLKQLHI